MNFTDIPIVELLPMKPPMVFLDRVLSYDDPRLVTGLEVRPGIPFFETDGVPAWVGIEYMAQSVAAHAGVKARLRGEPPLIGFLLGTRAYKCDVSQFTEGENLKINVEPLFSEEGLGAFACSIETDRPLASATVNVYQPDKERLADFWAGKIAR
jgi:predicted hotdog family 3-hydroxylacyl-ACP dehydratase